MRIDPFRRGRDTQIRLINQVLIALRNGTFRQSKCGRQLAWRWTTRRGMISGSANATKTRGRHDNHGTPRPG